MNLHEYFEWDDAKSKKNKIKHGVDLVEIVELFEKPYVHIEDTASSIIEDRHFAIGLFKNTVYVVSYAFRGDAVRIISARKGTNYECRCYSRFCHGKV
jgi:uncharacterized protein